MNIYLELGEICGQEISDIETIFWRGLIEKTENIKYFIYFRGAESAGAFYWQLLEECPRHDISEV